MWQLKTADQGEPWTESAFSKIMIEAAKTIIAFKTYPVSGVFFEMLFDTKSSDEQGVILGSNAVE